MALGIFMAKLFITRLSIPAHFVEKPCSSSNALFPRIDDAKIYGDE
jgi:hypothetical protein